jgi:hypothetical protein
LRQRGEVVPELTASVARCDVLARELGKSGSGPAVVSLVPRERDYMQLTLPDRSPKRHPFIAGTVFSSRHSPGRQEPTRVAR